MRSDLVRALEPDAPADPLAGQTQIVGEMQRVVALWAAREAVRVQVRLPSGR